MPFFEPCQFFNVVGDHALGRRMQHELRRNSGVRTHFRRRFTPVRLGTPSRYRAGDWVQVLDRDAIQHTLDGESKLRGLTFLPYQAIACGKVYRVQKVMRSLLDDDGVFRPISTTILLEGVDCRIDPSGAGCGRGCPLMFRDEWVKPAAEPDPAEPAAPGVSRFVRILSTDEIRSTLDRQAKRDGLLFMPEMEQWTGRRFRVACVVRRVFECDEYVPTRQPVYILEGLHCSGAVLGAQGRCDRGCSVLWHADWLVDDGPLGA